MVERRESVARIPPPAEPHSISASSPLPRCSIHSARPAMSAPNHDHGSSRSGGKRSVRDSLRRVMSLKARHSRRKMELTANDHESLRDKGAQNLTTRQAAATAKWPIPAGASPLISVSTYMGWRCPVHNAASSQQSLFDVISSADSHRRTKYVTNRRHLGQNAPSAFH